jgi:hypothetical protein
MEKRRVKQKTIFIEAQSSDDGEEEQFVSNPADDLPRNKLIEKLARGLQSFVQRAQKREGFRVDIIESKQAKWTPAPRECATMSTVDHRSFLIGGMNYEAIREIVRAKILGDRVEWERVPFTTGYETVKGR